MIVNTSFPFLLFIAIVSGCSESDCDDRSTSLEWKLWNPKLLRRLPSLVPLPLGIQRDETFDKIMDRVKSKRLPSSDLGFESIRNNAELSRTLLQQIIQNVHKAHDFPRFNRADSKENYHLHASYIPRLG